MLIRYYFDKISPKTPCCSASGKCGSSNDDCECWDCVNYLHSEYNFISDIHGKNSISNHYFIITASISSLLSSI